MKVSCLSISINGILKMLIDVYFFIYIFIANIHYSSFLRESKCMICTIQKVYFGGWGLNFKDVIKVIHCLRSVVTLFVLLFLEDSRNVANRIVIAKVLEQTFNRRKLAK